MGLASKLQAAQQLGGLAAGMMPSAGQGMMPGASPAAASGAYNPGSPYPAAGTPSPYPAPLVGNTVPSAPPAPYPASPYPPQNAFGSAPAAGGAVAPMATPGMPSPAASAAPYASAPPGMGVAPGQPPGQLPRQMPGPYPGVLPGGMAGVIFNKLQAIAAANQLQRFYSPQALQALASRLDSRVNFRDIAARWQMPVELALDLAALALYDIVIFADDSGSMAFEENGERIDDLKLIGSKVAEVATLFDDDGILMRFMNSPTEGNGLRSPADVNNLLSNVQYSGLTPLATALQAKVLQPIVFNLAAAGQLQKPVLVIAITDGEPTDNPRDLVVQVIKDARNRLAAQYGPKAVAFEFAQVGKDQRAQAFLGQLDKHPEVGGSIDCTSYFELESQEYARRGIQLSPSMWLVKMMVGSIDPSYDEGDE
eukprot:gene10678-10837_t